MSSEPSTSSISSPSRSRPSRKTAGIIVLVIALAGMAAYWTAGTGLQTPAFAETTADAAAAPAAGPPYEASTVVVISSSITSPSLQYPPPPLTRDMLDQQEAVASLMITDRAHLASVLQDKQVQATSWYQQNPDPGQRFENLQKSLRVESAPGTGLVTISFRATNAGDSATIVNAVARCFIEAVEHQYRGVLSSRLDVLMKQETDLKRMIKQIRDQKDTSITAALGLPGAFSGLNLAAEMWRLLAAELARSNIEEIHLKIAFDELKNKEPARDARATSEPAPTATAPADANSLERIMAAETEWLKAVWVQTALQERLDQAKAEIRDADRRLAQYQTLTDEEAILFKQYEQIQGDIGEVQVLMRLSDHGLVRIINPA